MNEVRAHYKTYTITPLYFDCFREDDDHRPVWIRIRDTNTRKYYYVFEEDKKRQLNDPSDIRISDLFLLFVF